MTMSGGFTGTMPAAGERVFTADGDELGTVKEVAGGRFKIDAPMQPDYWLPTGCITSENGSEVRLNFIKDRLGDMKVDGPRDEGAAHR